MFIIILAIIILYIIYEKYRPSAKYLIMRHSEREDAVNPSWPDINQKRFYDTPITENRKFFEKSIKKYDMTVFKGTHIYC